MLTHVFSSRVASITLDTQEKMTNPLFCAVYSILTHAGLLLWPQRLSFYQDQPSLFLIPAQRFVAKKFHPDANPGDKTMEAKFKEINEAYDVLKDPQKKAAYDRFGHQAFENGSGRRARPGGPGFGPDFSSSMSDIFEDLFGDMMGGQRAGGGNRQRRGGTGAQRGSDLRYNLEVNSPMPMRQGGKCACTSSVACETCKGSGAKPGTATQDLRHLQWRGRCALAIRLLHGGTRLPDLCGPWPGHRRPLQQPAAVGPCHQGTHTLGQYSGRRGRWYPHSLER